MKDDIDEFEKELIGLTKDIERGKYAKAFMNKEATKLRKKTKQQFDSCNIENGRNRDAVSKSFKKKAAKKTKYDVTTSVYSDHNITHLLNNGFVHKGGIGHNGKETFISGHHFMEEAKDGFKDEFIDDTRAFIDDMIDNHGL